MASLTGEKAEVKAYCKGNNQTIGVLYVIHVMTEIQYEKVNFTPLLTFHNHCPQFNLEVTH